MNISSLDSTGPAVHLPTAMAMPEQGRTANASDHVNMAPGNTDPSPEQLQQMVSDMQYQLDSMNVSLQYSLYGENGRNVAVKVVNKVTGEVIREIPPKEMQALQNKMSDLVGMIFNDNG